MMTTPSHMPYRSLEPFRLALTQKYLEVYNNNIIVQEKIHGSNIQITGIKSSNSPDGWEFHLGSRRRWITPQEKFSNIQTLFKESKSNIIQLFNNLYERFYVEDTPQVIRLFGEVFGGKYGWTSNCYAIKTQRDSNYGPDNDIAFFDAYISNNFIPINDLIETVTKYSLKVPPVIFRGDIADFLATFDVNKFKSVVSYQFYGLEYIDSAKTTEGVVIRSVIPNPEGDEAIILKYKQPWAIENPRVFNKTPSKYQNESKDFEDCLNMMNENRIISYQSKNTFEDLTNTSLLGTHVKEIVADTMRDVIDEFPLSKFPHLNHKNISRALSKKAFPLLKKCIESIKLEPITYCDRIQILTKENQNLWAEINSIILRTDELENRIALYESKSTSTSV